VKPVMFEGANSTYGPPPGFAESQVAPIPASRYQVVGGPCDGVEMVVVAWLPDAEDLARLNAGGPVYLSCIGGLPPHHLTTVPPPPDYNPTSE